VAYSDYSCSETEGHPIGAGDCFFAGSEPKIGSFKERCGAGANASAATSGSVVGTASPTGTSSIVTTRPRSSATSTQAGNGTFDISTSPAMGTEMNILSTTSPGLQISPTSSAASVCGGGKFVEVVIKALVTMGSVVVLWGMI
jgi:hypothetical protein